MAIFIEVEANLASKGSSSMTMHTIQELEMTTIAVLTSMEARPPRG